jgi:hypothetical protein
VGFPWRRTRLPHLQSSHEHRCSTLCATTLHLVRPTPPLSMSIEGSSGGLRIVPFLCHLAPVAYPTIFHTVPPLQHNLQSHLISGFSEASTRQWRCRLGRIQEPGSFLRKEIMVCVPLHRSHYDPPPQCLPPCFRSVICTGTAFSLKCSFYFSPTMCFSCVSTIASRRPFKLLCHGQALTCTEADRSDFKVQHTRQPFHIPSAAPRFRAIESPL